MLSTQTAMPPPAPAESPGRGDSRFPTEDLVNIIDAQQQEIAELTRELAALRLTGLQQADSDTAPETGPAAAAQLPAVGRPVSQADFAPGYLVTQIGNRGRRELPNNGLGLYMIGWSAMAALLGIVAGRLPEENGIRLRRVHNHREAMLEWARAGSSDAGPLIRVA